jgi:hypothetical protein
LRYWSRDISSHALGIDSSGCATRSIDGFSKECESGFWDSMSVETVGV